MLQPVESILAALDLPSPLPEFDVHSLDMKTKIPGADDVLGSDACLFTIRGACEVAMPPPRARAGRGEGFGADDGLEADDIDRPDFDEQSSDVATVDSGCESGAEDAAEEGDSPEEYEPGADQPDRAAWGDNVAFTNGYFTCSNYFNIGQAKIWVRPRWLQPGSMGTTDRTKTVRIKEYDTDELKPRVCHLVLRAWMLHRIRQDGFAAALPVRSRWANKTEASLREDILALGVPGGGTGVKAADARIKVWAPDVL